METTLRIKSGSGDAIYTLQIFCEDGNVAMFCDCSAGTYGKLCKHKIAVISNDRTGLENQEQDKNFEQAQVWIKGSSLIEMLADIRVTEKEVESAQTRVKKLKKALEMNLNNQISQKR
jgi:uncharacterized Zn finger protein